MAGKYVLVLEEELKSCLDCPCSCIREDVSRCEVTGDGLSIDDIYEQRPVGCPLREVPNKKVGFGTDTLYVMGRNQGWNDCIDKILGGE